MKQQHTDNEEISGDHHLPINKVALLKDFVATRLNQVP